MTIVTIVAIVAIETIESRDRGDFYFATGLHGIVCNFVARKIIKTGTEI